MHMAVLPTHANMRHVDLVPAEALESATNLLELKLWRGAEPGNRTWVLCKSKSS